MSTAISYASAGSSGIIAQVNEPSEWTQQLQRVPPLAESGMPVVQARDKWATSLVDDVDEFQIPVIDLSKLDTEQGRKVVLTEIADAAEQYGFFQVINHGVPSDVMRNTLSVWKEFFHLPHNEKEKYAINPYTLEGYGSKSKVEQGAILHLTDYLYFYVLPMCKRDFTKWPIIPASWREAMEHYTQHLCKLADRLLYAISTTLTIDPEGLRQSFGDEMTLSLRANFYPSCAEPDRALAVPSHSDPGGITILIQDEDITGLQVRHEGKWIAVKPAPGSLTVNIGDQLQIMSNGKYKSIEHRVVVNQQKERVSVAAFFSPGHKTMVAPIKELISAEHPAKYGAMTFHDYRSLVLRDGKNGKQILQSMETTNL